MSVKGLVESLADPPARRIEQVLLGRFERFNGISQTPKAMITSKAEQPPDFQGLMIMITVKEAPLGGKVLVRGFLADSTRAVLRFQQMKILIQGHAAMPELDTALKVAHNATIVIRIAGIDTKVFFEFNRNSL